VTDPEQIVVPSMNGTYGLSERLGAYNGFSALEEPPVNPAGGLVSLGFVKAAIGRSARLLCGMGVAGLVAGCAFYVASPPSYQATTSLLLTPGPYENINTAANNDQAMAQSRTVAGLAVQKLGLQENASSLLGAYTVAPITERVLRITFSAKSSDQAIQGASTVAAAFLQFRASEMRAEQKLVLASLNQQVAQAAQHLSSINAEISQLSAESTSADQQSRLKSLRNQRTQVTATLSSLQEAATGNQTVTQPATEAAVNGSVVLDPAAPLAHSRLKPLILEGGVGLVMGLALGLVFVVIRALVTDRLRRRDNVAQALGAPVRLSVDPVRRHRWLPGRLEQSMTRNPDVLRIAAHLGRLASADSGGMASLAVVPIDDLSVPAACLVSLASTYAAQGKQVVLADLCVGSPAAKLLGVEGPGVRTVNVGDARLVVVVPEPGDVAPVGPLDRGPAQAQRSSFGTEVASACVSADLLLTLAVLDPALGGEHLATWAAKAVAMVTAGQSSWTKIHGVGEMIRLPGTRLVSAVLVGADKTDESLGVIYTPETV
jgi:capsular polysaccharide biosynthesis protein